MSGRLPADFGKGERAFGKANLNPSSTPMRLSAQRQPQRVYNDGYVHSTCIISAPQLRKLGTFCCFTPGGRCLERPLFSYATRTDFVVKLARSSYVRRFQISSRIPHCCAFSASWHAAAPPRAHRPQRSHRTASVIPIWCLQSSIPRWKHRESLHSRLDPGTGGSPPECSGGGGGQRR